MCGIDNNRITVLFLSRYYNLTATAAGIRARRFVRGLTNAGMRLLVVTVGDKAGIQPVDDDGNVILCQCDKGGAVPLEIREVGLSGWIPAGQLPGPDRDAKVAGALFRMAAHLAARYCPDMIYSTGPPFTVLLAGRQAAKLNNLPWVAELRDAWFTAMPWPYKNRRQHKSAHLWEHRCIREADRIIVVTRTHQEILQRTYPDQAGKITWIPHSYDRELYPNYKPTLVKSASEREKNFILAYIGQIRGLETESASAISQFIHRTSQQIRRILWGATFCEGLRLGWMSPEYLIKAIGRIAASDESFGEKVRLIFAGKPYAAVESLARKYRLEGKIEQKGALSEEDVRKLLGLADVLVVNLYGIAGMDYHWCVPTKLYTYLASGKPVLALLPKGEAADMVKKAGTGFVCHPADTTEITRLLRYLYQQHLDGGIQVKPDWDFIKQFSEARQAERFLEVIKSVEKGCCR